MENYNSKLNELIKGMPFYVKDYYRSKRASAYSLSTLYRYLLEYRRFFQWLIDNRLIKARKIEEITLSDLEKLPKKNIEAFLMRFREELFTKNPNNDHQSTLQRALASLKGLYRYLADESEDENGNSYIERNVMSRVNLKKKEKTLAYRAAHLEDRLFLGTETNDFLKFVKEDYHKALSKRQEVSFNKNKERDLAILSLFLASGLRISELDSVDMDNFNIENLTMRVWRKEGLFDSVSIAPFAKPYLENYLSIRKSRYPTPEDVEPLFLAWYAKKAARISNATISKIVNKYSAAFKIRVTPHMLRHTLATRLYQVTSSQLVVSHQLGHSSTQATDLYTHITNTELKDALNKL